MRCGSWAPRPAVRPPSARLRPLAAASAILNALWLAVVQLGWLGISVLVILALLLVLIRIFMLLVQEPRRRPDRALDHVADLWPVPGVGERRDGCEHRGVAGLARGGPRCRLGATAGCGAGRRRRVHRRRNGALLARADVGGVGHGVGHRLDRRGPQRRRDVFDGRRSDCIYRRRGPAGVYARCRGVAALPAGGRCSEVRP